MKPNHLDATSSLWTVATKLKGIAELFKATNGDSEPFSEVGCSGIGYLLEALHGDLEAIRDLIEYGPTQTSEDE